jgi:hypothetical protein
MNQELEEFQKAAVNIWLKLLSNLNKLVLVAGAGIVAFDQTNHAMVQAAFSSLSPAKQTLVMIAFSSLVQGCIMMARKADK